MAEINLVEMNDSSGSQAGAGAGAETGSGQHREWQRVYGRRDGSGSSGSEDVGVTERGLSRGTLCTGRPGSGKNVNVESHLLQDMARSDRANVGKGGSPHSWNSTVLVDQLGDITDDLLDRLPASHELLTCVVDPLDQERVVSINPLEVHNAANSGAAGLTVAGVQEIFAKALGVTFDLEPEPPTFRVLQNALLLAVRSFLSLANNNNNGSEHGHTPATLKTLYRLLMNEGYRQACLDSLPHIDDISKDFWAEEFPQLVQKRGGADLIPFRNMLESLLTKDHIALLFGQARSTVNIRQMLDKGSNLFFRFSPPLSASADKDKQFMQAAVFCLIKQALFSRSDIPKEQRRLVSLYFDEFHETVGNDSNTLGVFLEQARKFGGAVCLSHQNLDQIEQLVAVLKENIGNWVTMNITPSDRPFFAERYASHPEAGWSYDRVKETFDKFPAFAMIAQLQKNGIGDTYEPVLLRSLNRPARAESLIPALISRNVPITEQTPRGYELITLEPYLKRENLTLDNLFQISQSYGYEGFWESTATARRKKIQPVNCLAQPQLIEELTEYLWHNNKLEWGVNPSQNRAAFEAAGLSVENYNTNRAKLRGLQEWLLELERLPSHDGQRQRKFEEMGETDWQLYRAIRYSRDLALVQHIAANPALLPEKRSRVVTFSRLQWGVPISEAKAEQNRPDKFMLLTMA
jgi:hypothetical protein